MLLQSHAPSPQTLDILLYTLTPSRSMLLTTCIFLYSNPLKARLGDTVTPPYPGRCVRGSSRMRDTNSNFNTWIKQVSLDCPQHVQNENIQCGISSMDTSPQTLGNRSHGALKRFAFDAVRSVIRISSTGESQGPSPLKVLRVSLKLGCC